VSRYTGAEIIVEYLVKEGVPYIFGLSGHGNVGFLEALHDRQADIKIVATRHEQAAGHMADAYFRVAHKPVATITSCGPGSANLPVAIASAMFDSSAFLAITGNVPTQWFNRGPFQETYRHYAAEFSQFLRPYVKRSFQPTRVEMLPQALRQAFKTMLTGRTGPVHLDVPLNLFVEESDVELPDPIEWHDGISSRSQGDPAIIDQAIGLLLAAERPLIMAGHGTVLSDAADEVAQLAQSLNIPVINTPNGKGIIDMHDPLSLGDVGRNGTYQANQAARAADVILAVGCKFSDRETSAWVPGYSFSIPPTKLIQVDIDPEEIGRNYPVHIGIIGDAKATLQQMLHRLAGRSLPEAGTRGAWIDQITAWKQEWAAYNEPHFDSAAVPIRPERVIQDMRAVLPEDAILVADVGVHHNWVVQYWKAYQPRTVLQSWGFASMGFGVCGVLGAKLAAPDQPCVAICGDAGFMMTNHIVSTAVEYGIPAVWVIWNNYAHGAIRDLQLGVWNRELATSFVKQGTGELFNPDFVAMSRAMGAQAERIERPQDFAEALDHALRSNTPFVLDVVVDRDIRPPAVGTWQLPPLPPAEPTFTGLDS
jgi:acetolactate synthase-1/2/3 large subunit